MYQKRNKELDVLSLYRGDYRARFYLRQISRLTKLPLKTTQDLLASLEKARIIRGEVEGRNKYFRLNLDNIKVRNILLQAEIYMTDRFLDKYSQFKTFLKSVKTDKPIIVFGSFARFAAGRDSDVDLLVVSGREEKLPSHLLPQKIHKITLSRASFVKALKEGETVIREIGENHVILNNHSFYVNIVWDYYG